MRLGKSESLTFEKQGKGSGKEEPLLDLDLLIASPVSRNQFEDLKMDWKTETCLAKKSYAFCVATVWILSVGPGNTRTPVWSSLASGNQWKDGG